MPDDLKDRFEAATVAAKGLPQRPGNTDMLEMYALYKQATVGDVQGERPGGFDFVGGAKYDAWSGLQGTTREQAMQRYVDKVESLQS